MNIVPEQIFLAMMNARYLGKYPCLHIDGFEATILVYQQSSNAWLGEPPYMLAREDDENRFIVMKRISTEYPILNPFVTLHAASPIEAINATGAWKVKSGDNN